jgi:hypothetical protein
MAEKECDRVGGGTTSAVFKSDIDQFHYYLESRDHVWSVGSYGYHATGMIYCRKCFSGENAFGLYNLGESYAVLEEYKFPRTVEARFSRLEETFGYPHKKLGVRDLRPLFGDNAVSTNDFGGKGLSLPQKRNSPSTRQLTGYATVFEIVSGVFESVKPGSDAKINKLLTLTLWDSCVFFDTAIAFHSPDGLEGVAVETLLNDLVFKRRTIRRAAKTQ